MDLSEGLYKGHKGCYKHMASSGSLKQAIVAIERWRTAVSWLMHSSRKRSVRWKLVGSLDSLEIEPVIMTSGRYSRLCSTSSCLSRQNRHWERLGKLSGSPDTDRGCLSIGARSVVRVGAIQSHVILLNMKKASSPRARPFGPQAYFDFPPSLMRTHIERSINGTPSVDVVTAHMTSTLGSIDQPSIVVLLGRGGVGKTRLSLQFSIIYDNKGK